MKKIFISVIAILSLIFGVCFAGVIADGSITVSTSVQGISTISDDASACLISVETGSVRIGFKTAPTSTTGHKLGPGDTMTLDTRADIVNFKVILDSGSGSATVRYSISSKR